MAAITTLTDGKIIVGSDTAYPPFEFVEGGETVGFDVDVVKAIGEKLGLEVEFLTYKFDALITDMQAGTVVRHGRFGHDDHRGARRVDRLLRSVHQLEPVACGQRCRVDCSELAVK